MSDALNRDLAPDQLFAPALQPAGLRDLGHRGFNLQFVAFLAADPADRFPCGGRVLRGLRILTAQHGDGWRPFEIEFGLVVHATIAKVNARRHAAWVLGALAGGSFVAITQLAVKSDPQPGDIRAMFWFAAALPLLAGSALILREGTTPKSRITRHIVQATAIMGPVFMVTAISEMLRAVGFWAAVAFGGLGTLMLILSMVLGKPDR